MRSAQPVDTTKAYNRLTHGGGRADDHTAGVRFYTDDVKRFSGPANTDAAALAKDRVNTVAIMPNDYASHPADSPQRMREFAKRHRFGFPYLIDETQQVARDWGAVCTPDFFGFNKQGELQYRGRLDDARMNEDKNRTTELVNAMRQIAETGEGPQEQYASMGCSIKWR